MIRYDNARSETPRSRGGRERAACPRPPAPATKGRARHHRYCAADLERHAKRAIAQNIAMSGHSYFIKWVTDWIDGLGGEARMTRRWAKSRYRPDIGRSDTLSTCASPADWRLRTTIACAAPSSGANTRARARLVFNLDSIEICPLIEADQKRRAGDRHDANSPLRTWATGQGRPWPVSSWHSRSNPNSGNARAFRHLRFVPNSEMARVVKSRYTANRPARRQ